MEGGSAAADVDVEVAGPAGHAASVARSRAAGGPSSGAIDVLAGRARVLVLDTNFLLAHVAWTGRLVAAAAATDDIAVLVPWVVLEELDVLKVPTPSKDAGRPR